AAAVVDDHRVWEAVTGAIRGVADQRFWLARNPGQPAHHLDVRPLGLPPDIVDLAQPPPGQYLPDGARVILDVQPVSHVQPGSVHRQLLTGQGAGDHQRDELLGKLVRAVVVGAARDDRGKVEGRDV